MDTTPTLPDRIKPALNEFPIQIQDRVRWGDVDGVGHANNVSFARYFEEGRLALLRGMSEPTDNPLFMLVHMAIDYQAQLHYPQVVDVGTRITKIGRSSVHFEQAIFQNGHCAATSRAVIAFADRVAETSLPIPDDLRQRLAERGMLSKAKT